MAQIRRRSTNTYTITVYMGRDDNGKRRCLNETFYGNRNAAQRRAAELEVRLKERIGPKGSAMTVEQLIDTWLINIKTSVGERTYSNYLLYARKIKPLIGIFQIYKVNSLDLQRELDKLEVASVRTKRDIILTVRSIFKKAVQWGILASDPSTGLTAPKLPYKKRDVLNTNELNILIDTAKGYKHGLILQLTALAGFRISEVLGLHWRELDLSKGTISVIQAANIRKRIIQDTKNNNSKRTILLEPELVEQLIKHKQKLENIFGKAVEDMLVFPSDDGKRIIRYNSVRETKNRIIKKAGLKGFRIHDLRHSVGSLLVDRGYPITAVAATLGQTPATTAGIYTHTLRQGKSILHLLKPDKSAEKN